MERVLGLRPDERATVGLASAVAATGAAGLTIAASSVDALLFSHGGVDDLPWLYVLLGLTMFAASIGVAALLGRLGRGRAFLLVPAAIALVAGVARVALGADVSWIYPTLWLLRGAAEFLVGLAVWGLAGLVTDTRQAKRFFPLIGAAAVLGQVLGGLLTRPLAEWLGTENLVLVWMGTLIVVAVLGGMLVGRADPAATRPRRRRTPVLEDLRDGARYALRSPLLRWMSVGSVLFSLLFFSLYLPFSRAAVERYPAPEDLAGFLGVFTAIATGVTLLLALLVMNRLLSRVGVPTVMMVLPILYLVAFGVLTISATFALLLAFRFAQLVWLQGGASTSWEAVINTVPGDRRDRVRAFLYGGPTQVGTVLAGVVTLIGERAVSPRVLFALGLLAAVAAVATMLRVRRAYTAELLVALREGRPHVFGATPGGGEPFGHGRADRTAASVAIGGMSDPDVGVRRVAAQLLGDLAGAGGAEALASGLDDEDAEVRATALYSLGRIGAFGAADGIPDRLADPVPEVRLAALHAVGALRADAAVRARPLLEDPDGIVRAHAAGILLADGAVDGQGEAVLDRLTRSPFAEARAAAYEALASSQSPEAAARARGGLVDPVPSVRAEAARAVLATDPAGGVDTLLASIERGGDVLEAAHAAVSASPDRASPPVRELAAASASAALADRRLADSILVGDDDRLDVLRDALLASSRDRAIAALQAIALLGDHARIDTALDSLAAADPAQRANALEVIETVADRELVRPLIALWEPERIHHPHPEWRAEVLGHPDARILAMARWALDRAPEDHPDEGGTMTETLTTLPTMERVLFLRRVPLFADLPPHDLLPIAEIATEHSFADADTIAEQGEPGDEMHIIVSGYVMVIIRESDGHQEVLAVRSAGDVIGEMAVVTGGVRMASLAARGDVRLLSIERRQFEAVLRERPETALALMRILCERLATLERGGAVPA